MKEATGEGSMTLITIVIIVALAAAAAILVGVIANKAKTGANDANAAYNCNTDASGNINCTKNS